MHDLSASSMSLDIGSIDLELRHLQVLYYLCRQFWILPLKMLQSVAAAHKQSLNHLGQREFRTH